MQSVHLRKYGEATNINFELYEIDGVDFRVDAVSASGDIKIMKDNGAEANTATTTFTDEGTGYSQPLSATEMQAARIVLYVVDQTGTKAWLDKSIVIETYGHASAQHAFDLDTAANWNVGKTGYTLTQAFPTNFSSLAIDGSGVAEAFMKGLITTALTEATLGRMAANFDTFFENADAVTTKTVDDVGGGTGSDWSASELNEIRGRLGITGTTAAGGNTPTLSLEATVDAAQADLDIITGPDGVVLDTTQSNYAPAKAGANMGSVSSVAGNVNGSVASVVAPVATDTASRNASKADVSGLATTSNLEARTPTAAQLAYIVANAATAVPITFTTAGGSTTAAVFNLVDGSTPSSVDDRYKHKVIYFDNGAVASVDSYTGSSTTATISAVDFAVSSSTAGRLV